MKIAVNGKIIDTKDIYVIDEITMDFQYFFTIRLFNGISIPVYTGITNEKFEKLKSLRKEIIKLWSDNQSDIPQFNI